MYITPYVAALRENLIAAAAAGDEQTQRTAELLAAAIEPAARLTLLNAMSDMAGEVTEALGGERTVEVRLDGRQVRIAVSEPAQPASDPPPPSPGPEGAAGDVSRITLRLMEQIKNHAEQAASAQGMSLNSWISQAVQGALSGSQSRKGRDWDRPRGRSRDDEQRLRGWVQG